MIRIQRIPVTISLAYATDDNDAVSSAVTLNGKLLGLIPVAPNLDSTNTYSVTLKDVDGYTIYTKASLAESVATPLFVDANNYALNVPVSGSHTIAIQTSGAQTADRTFTVILLVESYS